MAFMDKPNSRWPPGRVKVLLPTGVRRRPSSTLLPFSRNTPTPNTCLDGDDIVIEVETVPFFCFQRPTAQKNKRTQFLGKLLGNFLIILFSFDKSTKYEIIFFSNAHLQYARASGNWRREFTANGGEGSQHRRRGSQRLRKGGPSLDENSIEELPASVCNLVHLKSLSLNNNNVKQLFLLYAKNVYQTLYPIP
ncbi:Leucine-rich repeat domain superfamily [Forsythia ovata]|uniref:Leucine-rich repeat domain superfamily n=1 Tax=Forsythia ovata TaxID=205694 RepID=A0ABD1VN29_9LAMI